MAFCKGIEVFLRKACIQGDAVVKARLNKWDSNDLIFARLCCWWNPDWTTFFQSVFPLLIHCESIKHKGLWLSFLFWREVEHRGDTGSWHGGGKEESFCISAKWLWRVWREVWSCGLMGRYSFVSSAYEWNWMLWFRMISPRGIVYGGQDVV